ncbi:DNA polymerase epsilon catalytic subunit [Ascosphaera acerosa]|nr:DNA polymerase epsilon catalytic subunit [Ascosphaera acerosa]
MSRRPAASARKFRSDAASYNPKRQKTVDYGDLRASEVTSQDEKFQAIRQANEIDEALGFPRYEAGRKRTGWLINMHSTAIEDPRVPGGRAGVDFYFLDEDGDNFKATVEYDPYFLIAVKARHEAEVEEWCKRKFEGAVKSVRVVVKEDLSLPSHIMSQKRKFMQLSFANVTDLLKVRRELSPMVEKNKRKLNAMDTYAEMMGADAGIDLFDDDDAGYRATTAYVEPSEFIIDIREYDVPYHVRVSIDKDIRIGKWYEVTSQNGVISLSCLQDRLTRAEPVVLAFDIETTKLPLKFPDPVIDQIMMISYMIDGQGYLITNRAIVAEDIADFDYTPKPEYEGPFTIFNEPDERALIERFFAHIQDARPTVIATYNGDFFDWPFVEARASIHGIDMYMEIGFRKNSEDIYQSDHCVHMDCFAWVNRDSYLPQGSRGLKAVTTAKLGYDPDELDPEVMTPYASERPQTLAEYSVSDAVATYYLYMKYIHPFIFSLCTILPLAPDDVLRKGTGTLCEMLLMVQAYKGNIILPNKHVDPPETFYEGHLVHSETYVGGHVESIEAGVFRSDIPFQFNIDPTAADQLMEQVDSALKFFVTVEEKKSLEDVTNFEEVKQQIVDKLVALRDRPNRKECPLIYHLDVASMYPNIMTTNRLQPDSMIQEDSVAATNTDNPESSCDRRLPWAWRVEYFPAKRDEYNMIRNALLKERFPGKRKSDPPRAFEELSAADQAVILKKRLQDYSKKVYHKIHESKTIVREAIICQRVNPFYVNTVRDFRDRRYDFKGQQKVWKGKTEALKKSGAAASEIDQAKKMIVLFDSLQLAHKVILNSFYGYVMRKGSRWYSMEMAGVTCLTGARIIQMARELVERVGRPLELDTDGIWCMLPKSFPDEFTMTMKNGKRLNVSYPCIMLNHLVHERFTNHQYQTLKDKDTMRYETHSENSIFFEVDGPYRAMVLPTSKEEDKNLKKRYAVFNNDGSLAELKGFEVKRRGELKLIKTFQTQIFRFFLEGSTLEAAYQAVAEVANRWLDVLDLRGTTLADEELIDLICENKSMTKSLEEYGAQKSTSITTARRLAEFLGDQMVKDKGLNCKFIIADRPKGAPVTDRAIPVAIFSAQYAIKRFFLRKWLRDDPGDMDPRGIIDWEYYKERLGSVIQKLITIPAALQKIRNPVPRITHPEWLQKRITQMDDKYKQQKLTFQTIEPTEEDGVMRALQVHALDHKLPSSTQRGVEDIIRRQKAMTLSQEPPQSQKRKAADKATAFVDPFAALPPVMPDMHEDYHAFLKYQKQKWAIQKEARARRRKLFGEKRVNAVNEGIAEIFRNQAEMIYVNTWQIIELRETDAPGELKMFVLIGNKVQSLRVHVPRSILVNFKSDDIFDVDLSDATVEPSNEVVPNGHPSVHLYRLTMSEDTWLRDADQITVMLDHPSVEGVYEKKLPLSMRALLQLGCKCTFDDSRLGILGEGLERGFQLSTLLKAKTNETYLSGAQLEYLYLYHVAHDDKEVYALFSSHREEAYLVVYTGARDVQGLPNADKIYAEELQQKAQQEAEDHNWGSMFSYQRAIRINRSRLSTRRKAALEVNDLIKRLGQTASYPAIVVIQSSANKPLSRGLPILADYPVLTLRPAPSDLELPSLGWQTHVVRRSVSAYLGLGTWLDQLTALARYGDIPLCNLDSDDPKFIIDVAYARSLQKEGVALWWSPSPTPDHGGFEKDDVLGPLQQVELASVNNSGAYTTVCIDVEIRNLSINTILTSALINELEGSESTLLNAAMDDGDGSGVLYSDKAFSSASLVVLRDLVKSWWTQACQGNGMADVMVQHLIRWIESPDAHLYDHALHYYVQVLSKKAFQQLMTDFRRVGSHIVFASPNKLIVQTTKSEIEHAIPYSQWVLKSIKSKPLFHFVDLEIREYWDYLLWYDEFNYGGKAKHADAQSSSQQLKTVMNWQLSRFLPQHLQGQFVDWVAEYIELMCELKRARQQQPVPVAQVFMPMTQERDDDAVSTVLKTSFAKPLKKAVAMLIRRQRDEMLHPELATDYTFPSIPGSSWHSDTRNPALEFVKLLMQILSLSKATTLETRMLRQELLALFDIREFADEGRFENPTGSLKLAQLTCSSCTMTRDLDLCRDADVVLEQGDKPADKPWLCSACHSEFNKQALEEQMIGDIEGMVTEWATQDLRCDKCNVLRVSEFMEHCSCGGAWAGTLRESMVQKRLFTYASVAEFYDLHMLREVSPSHLKKLDGLEIRECLSNSMQVRSSSMTPASAVASRQWRVPFTAQQGCLPTSDPPRASGSLVPGD